MTEYLKKLVKEIDYFYEYCPKEEEGGGAIISFRNNVWEIPMNDGIAIAKDGKEAVDFIEESGFDLVTLAYMFEAKLGTKVLFYKKQIESITELIGKDKVQWHLDAWEETFAQIEKALDSIVKKDRKKQMKVIEGGEG